MVKSETISQVVVKCTFTWLKIILCLVICFDSKDYITALIWQGDTMHYNQLDYNADMQTSDKTVLRVLN